MSGMAVVRLLSALALACLLAMVVLFATGVQAQERQCGPRADLVKYLAEKFHEVPIAIGMINDQLIMETYSSPAGTWTMFLTDVKNNSCIVADGNDWAFDTSAFDAAKKKGPKA